MGRPEGRLLYAGPRVSSGENQQVSLQGGTPQPSTQFSSKEARKMRAYPCVRIGIAIAFVMAVCVVGIFAAPQHVMAVTPEIEMQTTSNTGGTSGGAEWRTEESNAPGELPLDERGAGVVGSPQYSQGAEGSEAQLVQGIEAALVRMVRFVGATFSQLF